MMDTDMITKRIAELTAEQESVTASHNLLLQQVSQNQVRYAQLKGAIDALTQLLKETQTKKENQ